MIPYRIALITDLHIDNVENMNYQIDSKSNLRLLLDDIKKYKIHHIIIAGDLCNSSPRISIYKWIKEQLDEYMFSYNVIPGNHDNSEMIKEVFGLKSIVNVINEWGRRVLFLDTSKDILPIEQLELVSEQIGSTNKEIVIFMHHPPGILNHSFMENNYPLKNINELQEVLTKTERSITIFCGHYHAEIDANISNQKIFVTPSNVFQIDEDSHIFEIKTFNPGWRYIEFHENGINTEVKYIILNKNKEDYIN